MDKMIKVMDKDNFVKTVLKNASNGDYTEGQIYTMRKVAENTKKARIDNNGNALVLLSTNVFKVTYPAFVESIEANFHFVSHEDVDTSMILELDANDRLINKC